MWGGRFAVGPAEIMEEINASIGFDRKLAAQDIAGSLAHVAMLAAQGVVDAADAEAIAKGLAQVKGEIEAGTFAFSRALEDIHMNVESRLAEIVGPAAGRLHTARSRNGQVRTVGAYFSRAPSGTSSRNPASTGAPSGKDAASSIPFDSRPRIMRGARLATITILRPMSFSGS